MTRKELHHRILNALGVGAAGAVSLGSGPCGNCPSEHDTQCIDLDDYRRWVASTGDAAAPVAGAGGASAEDECPTVEEFGVYALSGEVPNGPDVTWLEKVERPSYYAVTDAGLQCCYSGDFKQRDCPGGRPFLIRGSARLATLTVAGEGDGAPSAYADHPGVPLEELATAWLRSALTEHASVAAFARLTLQLLSVGAPPELVEGAQRASLDELRHAELCLARAHRTARHRHRLGALDVGGCLDTVTLVELARLNVVEGCIGETLAAAVMAEQAERALDADLARELRGIAEDESNHAALAWRIARWAIAQGGSEVHRAVRREFAAWQPPSLDTTPTPLELEMATLGHLDARSSALTCRSTFCEVILPLALELERGDPAGASSTLESPSLVV